MSVIQISAKDAFAFLAKDADSMLVDVRTPEETNFVGIVDPAELDERMALIPWKLLPDMRLNPNFTSALTAITQENFTEKALDAKIFFMCRSGARSDQAAYHATTLGFKNCYNIIGGFEGDIDSDNHRGNINGWKAENLPWRQS